MSAATSGQADGPPPPPEQSAPFELGPARHAITVRGLTVEEYVGASRQLVARVRKELRRKPAGVILYLAAMLVAGGLIGYLLARYTVSAFVIAVYGQPPQSILLTSWPSLAFAASIFAAGIAMPILSGRYYQKLHDSRAIARNRTFAMPQTLAFSDTGVQASCQAGLTAVPWSRFSHRFRHAGLQFLVIDQALLLWIPDADLAANSGLAQFLDRHMPVPVQ